MLQPTKVVALIWIRFENLIAMSLFSVCANYCYVIKYLDDVIYWNDLEARDCCILMLGNFRNKELQCECRVAHCLSHGAYKTLNLATRMLGLRVEF